MPLSISSQNQTALEDPITLARDFLWIVGRNRDDGTDENYGYWSGIADVTADVLNPLTGLAAERDFYGAGRLVEISDIRRVIGLSVQTVTIRMSQVDDVVQQMIRDSDVQQGRIEIYRGLLDKKSRMLVAPALNRFFGFVNFVDIKTPKEGETGYAELTCTEHTQEALRSNSDTRSHESQILRSATDNFFQDVATVGEWENFWGKANGKLDTAG